MKYKAFISSTKKDLGKQRGYVAEQLRQANIDVDPMEDWPADAENPVRLSAKRTKGCHFCIAIVAFQRGTLATNDRDQRSITQIEIDTAKLNGAKILYFLLEDRPSNTMRWPEQYNHLADTQVQKWRKGIQSDRTCQYFQAGDGIDSLPQVLPAVMRQIVDWEERRRKRMVVALASLVCGMIVLAAGLWASATFRRYTLSQLLSLHDPVVFQHSRSHQYNLARLIDGRSDLRDNTNLKTELSEARTSFDMFANTFSLFRDYENDFRDMAIKGVRVRIVMTDFSEDNRPNWEPFVRAAEIADTQEASLIAHNICKSVDQLCKQYPESVELRLNRKPILYTMWLRDSGNATGIAHLGVNYYSGITKWPHFRVSRTTGGRQLESLQEQFDLIWKDAFPYRSTPLSTQSH